MRPTSRCRFSIKSKIAPATEETAVFSCAKALDQLIIDNAARSRGDIRQHVKGNVKALHPFSKELLLHQHGNGQWKCAYDK